MSLMRIMKPSDVTAEEIEDNFKVEVVVDKKNWTILGEDDDEISRAASYAQKKNNAGKDRRQAEHVYALIVTAQRALGEAIREAQRHPMASTTLKFLELAVTAADEAEEFCTEEMREEDNG